MKKKYMCILSIMLAVLAFDYTLAFYFEACLVVCIISILLTIKYVKYIKYKGAMLIQSMLLTLLFTFICFATGINNEYETMLVSVFTETLAVSIWGFYFFQYSNGSKWFIKMIKGMFIVFISFITICLVLPKDITSAFSNYMEFDGTIKMLIVICLIFMPIILSGISSYFMNYEYVIKNKRMHVVR